MVVSVFIIYYQPNHSTIKCVKNLTGRNVCVHNFEFHLRKGDLEMNREMGMSELAARTREGRIQRRKTGDEEGGEKREGSRRWEEEREEHEEKN